ncbi:MAG TPA: MFS transporter [Abditibacterium sp.]
MTSSIPTADPRRWLALSVILSATLLGVVDFLIVNLALPSIKKTIGASDAQVQLTVAVYGLAFAVCLITGGRLGDIYGRKRIFQIGMAGFTFASALCGFAQTPLQLVGFRVIQGAFAALMSPQVLATIQVTFAGAERDKATGFLGATVGIGSLLGNALGGWLVGANLFGLEWRPIFFLNVPIGIVALLLSHKLVRESKSERAQKLDVPGALISGVALFCLIFPIAEGRETGWPLWAFALFFAAGFIGWGFIVFEKNLARSGGSPLISLELFENHAYARGLLAILLLFSGLSSFSFVFAQFLQRGLGVSPQVTGSIFAALSLSFFISSIGAVKVVGKYGPKSLLFGIAIMQIGQLVLIALCFFYRGNLSPYALIPVLFFYGLGQGLSVPQVIRQTMNTVGATNAGAASGLLSTAQQVAFSLGVSVVGGVFFAIADAGKSPDSFARGTATAFFINFLLVSLAAVLIARNIRIQNAASQDLGPVVVET